MRYLGIEPAHRTSVLPVASFPYKAVAEPNTVLTEITVKRELLEAVLQQLLHVSEYAQVGRVSQIFCQVSE